MDTVTTHLKIVMCAPKIVDLVVWWCYPCIFPLLMCLVNATCQFDCNGHGMCNNGLCVCAGNWTGPYCSSGTTEV
jgi:hypothetical protein